MADGVEEVDDATWDEALLSARLPLYSKGFARPRLPIGKNRRVVPIHNSINQRLHINCLKHLLLRGLIIKNPVKLEHFLSFFSQFYPISLKTVPNFVFVLVEVDPAADGLLLALVGQKGAHADVDRDGRHLGWLGDVN